MKRFLEVGEIVGTHGIRGEMRLHPWADSPEFLKKFKTLYFDERGEKSVKVEQCRPHGNIALVKLEGVDTVEQAAVMRGRVLFMDRNDAKLPAGQYFIQDLIGCSVMDADDGSLCYGELSDVSATGANDVWHITAQDKKEYLIPAIPDVVKDVNVEEGWVKIRPLKGIFDDED